MVVVGSTANDAALTAKLEPELGVCKSLSAAELNALATEHILRTFGKRKRVVASLLWPKALVIPDAPDASDKARANVVARLFGSATVKEVMAVVVDQVEVAMGLQEEEAPKKKVERAVVEEQAEAEEEEGLAVKPSGKARLVEETEEFAGFSDEEPAQPAAKKARTNPSAVEDMTEDTIWERLMDPNAKDFDEFEERIGASDEEDDDEEDEDEDATNAANELARTDDEWSGGSDVDSDAVSDEDSAPSKKPTTKAASAAPPKPAAPTKKPATKTRTPAPPETSQFLPSLMAGYVSGGDSDADAEWYANNSTAKRGPPEKKERKNRMGQQARRALWEKMYGQRASHVQQRAEKDAEKQAKREMREAARTGGGHKEKIAEGPLHPSWEAARKAKEKQAVVAAAMAKPVGKKITFD